MFFLFFWYKIKSWKKMGISYTIGKDYRSQYVCILNHPAQIPGGWNWC